MDKFLAALRAIRILDEQNRVSLTNIALIVVLVYLLRRPEFSSQDLLALAGALASYQFKRWVQPDASNNEAEDMKKMLADLQSKVTSLQLGNSIRK